ncbi:hypothetical protein VNO78_29000 [Psophocarpus tetragonolobus]|uniref:Uncharacterized protein n=1 Tax=Psophocarpus tetragonolobus TaxID=3891 RepID=A0AAN9X062_PSOTE
MSPLVYEWVGGCQMAAGGGVKEAKGGAFGVPGLIQIYDTSFPSSASPTSAPRVASSPVPTASIRELSSASRGSSGTGRGRTSLRRRFRYQRVAHGLDSLRIGRGKFRLAFTKLP